LSQIFAKITKYPGQTPGHVRNRGATPWSWAALCSKRNKVATPLHSTSWSGDGMIWFLEFPYAPTLALRHRTGPLKGHREDLRWSSCGPQMVALAPIWCNVTARGMRSGSKGYHGLSEKTISSLMAARQSIQRWRWRWFWR
jgi:hypothetical protein